MVESQNKTEDLDEVLDGLEDEEKEAVNPYMLPAAVLSVVCGYLTHYQIGKLGSSSLYLNQATHMHYKLLCT